MNRAIIEAAYDAGYADREPISALFEPDARRRMSVDRVMAEASPDWVYVSPSAAHDAAREAEIVALKHDAALAEVRRVRENARKCVEQAVAICRYKAAFYKGTVRGARFTSSECAAECADQIEQDVIPEVLALSAPPAPAARDGGECPTCGVAEPWNRYSYRSTDGQGHPLVVYTESAGDGDRDECPDPWHNDDLADRVLAQAKDPASPLSKALWPTPPPAPATGGDAVEGYITDAMDWSRIMCGDVRALDPAHQGIFDLVTASRTATGEDEVEEVARIIHDAHAEELALHGFGPVSRWPLVADDHARRWRAAARAVLARTTRGTPPGVAGRWGVTREDVREACAKAVESVFRVYADDMRQPREACWALRDAAAAIRVLQFRPESAVERARGEYRDAAGNLALASHDKAKNITRIVKSTKFPDVHDACRPWHEAEYEALGLLESTRLALLAAEAAERNNKGCA